MKNLSLETCRRLKDAGFPQPEKAIGQLWYVRDVLCVVFRNKSTIYYVPFYAAALDGNGEFGMGSPEDWVYCPTALEIAEKIEYCTIHLLQPYNQQIEFGAKRHCWQSSNLTESLAEIWIQEHSNPA